MEVNKYKNKIFQYLDDDLSLKEKKKIIKWINENEDNQKVFSTIKAEYVATQMKEIEALPEETEFELIHKNSKNKFNFQRIAFAAAAVFLLFFLLNNYRDTVTTEKVQTITMVKIVVNNGENQTINLPDGSIVNLNSGSSITYPSEFSNNLREVKLTGEAFFDIFHNPNKPFVVKTSDIDIKVLGTSFNIKSYSTDDKIETTLVTGKVEVLQNNNKSLIFLEPSQRATFNKEKLELEVQKVAIEDVIAWREGKLVFYQTPIKEIVFDLERKYNVNFEISSKELLSYEYTGTFDNLTLKEVLNMLKLSSSINYKFTNNKIILNL